MVWRGLVIAGATLGVATTKLYGCGATRAGTPAPQPATTARAVTSATATSTASPMVSTTPPAPPEPSPAEERAAAVEAARRCDAPSARITNAPPKDATVFNNAQTDPDAGYIDRLATIVAAIRDNAEYRCCFDAWQSAHQGEGLKVMLQLTLDPKGGVTRTGIDARRSSSDDEILVGCLGAVARDTSFPPSPTGKDTHVDYPFVVATAQDSPRAAEAP